MTRMTCKQALNARYKVIAVDPLSNYKVNEEDCTFEEASRFYEHLKRNRWIVEAIPTHLLLGGKHVTLEEFEQSIDEWRIPRKDGGIRGALRAIQRTVEENQGAMELLAKMEENQ